MTMKHRQDKASETKKQEGPSNEYVLNVAFLSFVFFIILQGSIAIIAKSEAMFADTMAMSVDAFTYLFNMGAERLKHKHSNNMDPRYEGMSQNEIATRRKAFRLYLEFIPPLLSVTALIVVSIQALQEAINTIMNQLNSGGEIDNIDDTPNVNLMLFFSALNLGLDILNVSCFAKADNFSIAGMENLSIMKRSDGLNNEEDATDNLSSDDGHDQSVIDNVKICRVDLESGVESIIETKELLQNHSIDNYGSTSGVSEAVEETDSNISESVSEETNGINLNMCSAYTHVVADTLRSIAVLIAAGLAYSIKAISPSMADACATIVVSIIIALSLGPLVIGLVETWKEMVELRRERKMEVMIKEYDVFLEEFNNLQLNS